MTKLYICKECGPKYPHCIIRCPGIDPFFCPGGDGSEEAKWEPMEESEAGREVIEAYERADHTKMEQGA